MASETSAGAPGVAVEAKKPYDTETYYAMTLDPVHVGTGGYRLGRVDNAIVREPGTKLPKIPGTSISGVCRAYSAMAIQSANPAEEKYLRANGTSCAGKGGAEGDSHCGNENCKICVSFGFSKGPSNSSFQGLAQFFDARILFFPVYSMKGPVWVTSPTALVDSKIFPVVVGSVADGKFKALDAATADERLNFGWLYLERDGGPGDAYFTKTVRVPGLAGHNDRVYVVNDKLFSRIVNDNLEVRTSVAIDPATGAAEDGALYTYEAIPRATLMWFDVAYNKPEYFKIKDRPIEVTQAQIIKTVENGLKLLKDLGLGGMNTRGMGRCRVMKHEGDL
ncbi:MAG: type III-B CRISPR module RAMP protein Cmr4 [Deltaproteobacteria bacterium]|nr:type III-B CRISPR module RAMP protein Cmr4 [Deltaproteobacteria bacterium]